MEDRTSGRFTWISISAQVVMLLLLVVMVARVAQLQLAPGEDLQKHLTPRTTARTQLPMRGDILDRRGRLLSASRFGERVFVDPTMLPSPPHEAIRQIAELAGLPEEELGNAIIAAIDLNKHYYASHPDEKAPEDKPGALKKLLEIKDRPATPIAMGALSPLDESDLNDEDEVGEGDADPTASALSANAGSQIKLPKRLPIRFLPITGIVSDDRAQEIRKAAIPGVSLEQRALREYPGGEVVASIIGQVGIDQKGLMGAEWLANDDLVGKAGRTQYVRDAKGRPLWTDPGEMQLPLPGRDVRLTIDLEIQRLAYAELLRGIEEADAAGGRLVIVDPHSGEILAMVDIVRDMPDLAPYPWVERPKVKGSKAARPSRELLQPRRYITLAEDKGRKKHPALGRNRCIEDVYEPGSTFKPFVWSVITELKRARMDEVFDTEGGRWRTSYGRPIEDVTKRPEMTWPDVLKNSSNIGMIKAAERLSFKELRDCVVRFGFGKPTGLGLPGEAGGIVTPVSRWSKYTQTSVAYGHEVAVTPVQMVQAFSSFARQGELTGTLPQLHMIAESAGSGSRNPTVVYRVLPPDIARLAREPMAGVVTAMEERWCKSPDESTPADKNTPRPQWQYRLFGKSGTAEIPLGKAPDGRMAPPGSTGYFDNQYNSSFIAAGPFESPRLVCIVVIDDPGPKRVRERSHYGAAVAGPVVRRVMEKALAYVGAPVSVREEPAAKSEAQTSSPSVPASTR